MASHALRRAALALRLAARGLRRAPGTTALAVSILALGLAAPTVFFSLLVGAIRPLPVPEGDRVVRIDVVRPASAGRAVALAADDLSTLEGASSLSAMGGFRVRPATLVDPGSAAVRVSLAELSPSVLPMLRVAPALGRLPELTDGGDAMLIGHDTWLEMYDGDPGAVGRTVTTAGRPRTIVGIMPEGFGFPFGEDAWLVFDPDADVLEAGGSDSRAPPLELVGRLADAVAMEAATAELGSLWGRGDALRDPERRGGVLVVDGFTAGRGEGGEAVAFIGLVLVAMCLLLIACANVANLLLARASERVRALGIQSALGAGRLHIGAQLLLESLLLSVAGGGLGLLLANAAVGALERALSAEHFGYHWMRMAVDGTVVAFVAVLVLGTALVAGWLPAGRVLSLDVRAVLGGPRPGLRSTGGWGRAFVTVQLSLSCAALVAAALTARSLWAALDFSGEVPAEELLVAQLGLDGPLGPSESATLATLLGTLRGIPDVRAAALATAAPGYMERWARLEIAGEGAGDQEDGADLERTFWNSVTSDYFSAVGLETLSGRPIDDRDAQGAARVAVVNQSFVRRFVVDGPALGLRLRVGAHPDSASWHTVVGVVSDAAVGRGERVRHDRVYLPLGQTRAASVMTVLRSTGDAAALAPELRRAVASVDPTLPLSQVRTLADGHAWLTRVPRTMGLLALGGGLAGLVVAAVGLYGLLAFRVRERRHELGVRLALGADRFRLARETVQFAMGQLVPAAAVGLGLAWLAGPLLSVIVLGMDPRSPATLAAAGATFLAVGLVSVAIPTMRAARTDPAEALRAE